VTFDPGTPPADADDHVLAGWLAMAAGRRLLEVRQEGLEGGELKDAGDRAAHELLMDLLGEHRPGDAVLSEEGRDDKLRLGSDRVWIVDPLDGTREFSEPPRDDWAVHVALWQRGAGADGDGDLVAGAVDLPALGQVFTTGTAPELSPATAARPRIAVSRSRPPAFTDGLVAALGGETVAMGSAGFKVVSVVRDVTDAYVHAGGQYEWDSAAPVAVARAAGLFTSRVDGSPLRYNQDEVYLPDLVVCRPELAEQILAYLADHGVG
jgi:3'(2'), 5'-bisphosphate nucleotidase